MDDGNTNDGEITPGGMVLEWAFRTRHEASPEVYAIEWGTYSDGPTWTDQYNRDVNCTNWIDWRWSPEMIIDWFQSQGVHGLRWGAGVVQFSRNVRIKSDWWRLSFRQRTGELLNPWNGKHE